MIATGVMKAISSATRPYIVSLPISDSEGTHYGIAFFVSNPMDIPYDARKELDTNKPIAGVFEFDPQDQFATYLPDDKIEIKKLE